jgi:DNA invertase Pin-like site-specific DNA recombinase
MQVSELTDYALKRGWQIVDRYLDCRVSGSKESRPALNRLMNDARQRKFDILLVWKIDRFGRSLKHPVNSLAELESVGVAFVSLREGSLS